MLAKGKGIINVEKFREMFDLPEDTEVVNIRVEGNEIVFEMISAEEVEGKFIIDEYGYENIRKFRLRGV